MEMREEIGSAAFNLAVLESVHGEASSCNEMPHGGWAGAKVVMCLGSFWRSGPSDQYLSFNPQFNYDLLKM